MLKTFISNIYQLTGGKMSLPLHPWSRPFWPNHFVFLNCLRSPKTKLTVTYFNITLCVFVQSSLYKTFVRFSIPTPWDVIFRTIWMVLDEQWCLLSISHELRWVSLEARAQRWSVLQGGLINAKEELVTSWQWTLRLETLTGLQTSYFYSHLL